MIRYRRPAAPAAFEKQARAHRRRASPTGSFENVWKTHKHLFGRHQYGKCGYCECSIVASQDGDVEHFAPKARLDDISADPTTWGIEANPGAANLRRGSRVTFPRAATGFWWRAYDWSNYLLACSVCNTKYKACVFPLTPTPPAGWSPRKDDTTHRPLLLNCFDDEAPWRHFHVDPRTAHIGGASDHGTRTIATCGLHRESLRVARAHITEQAFLACARIADPSVGGSARDHAWRDLASLGRDDKPFAGCVRNVAEAALGLRWDEIVAFTLTT